MMSPRVVPMIHVPDVRSTVDWYKELGFTVLDTYGDDADGLSFAVLSYGSTRIMFSAGGQHSDRFRREVDLYIYADRVDDIYQQLEQRVDIVEPPHDTFYGMREFIIRDINRFWMTFAQPSLFQTLLIAVRGGDLAAVRDSLNSEALKAETLTAALATAQLHNHPEIEQLLLGAGVVPPALVDTTTLNSYAGSYNGPNNFQITVSFRDDALFAAPGKQQPLRLFAIDQFTFKPIDLDNYGTLTFKVSDGVVEGCVLRFGDHEQSLKRSTWEVRL